MLKKRKSLGDFDRFRVMILKKQVLLALLLLILILLAWIQSKKDDEKEMSLFYTSIYIHV